MKLAGAASSRGLGPAGAGASGSRSSRRSTTAVPSSTAACSSSVSGICASIRWRLPRTSSNWALAESGLVYYGRFAVAISATRLSTGTHLRTAVYLGDDDHAPSSAPVFTSPSATREPGVGIQYRRGAAILSFVEGRYNRRRLHSTLLYTTPADYDEDYHRLSAAACSSLSNPSVKAGQHHLRPSTATVPASPSPEFHPEYHVAPGAARKGRASSRRRWRAAVAAAPMTIIRCRTGSPTTSQAASSAS